MVYIQRVAQTARLLGTKGSALDREVMSDKIHAQFFEMLTNKLEEQGFASEKQLGDFYQKLMPNVDVEVTQYAKSKNKFINFINKFKIRQSIGEFKLKGDNPIAGYILKTNFSTNENIIMADDLKNVGTIVHENTHLCNAVLKPKYATAQLPDLPKKKRKQIEKLYDKELYKINPKIDNEDPLLILKKKINKFFSDNKFSPEEKITSLDAWRYNLKDENSAYENEIASIFQLKEIKALKEFETKGNCEPITFRTATKTYTFSSELYQTTEEKIEKISQFLEKYKNIQCRNLINAYEFPKKIKIVEDLMSAEMAKAGHDVKAWSVKN